MLRAIEVLAATTLLSQLYSTLDRNDIRQEFTINLNLKTQLLEEDYNAAFGVKAVIIQEISNSTSTAVLNASKQIQDTLKKIGDAKAQANSTAALECISELEEEAGKLSGDDIAKNCSYVNATAELEKTVQMMYVLSEVPRNTFGSCQDLNPFPTQNKSFLECVVYNIVDLNVQRRILQGQFSEDRQDALDQSYVCLSGALASITQQISDITFHLAMCVLM